MTVPVPSVRVLILTVCLIHACAMHVFSQDIIVRPPGVLAQSDDFYLEFTNLWGVSVMDSDNSVADVRLKCYAVLYKGRSHITVHLRDFKFNLFEGGSLAFYVKPDVYTNFRVQCDYWDKLASSMARMGGVILWNTRTTPRVCLEKDGGCEIRFENGGITQRNYKAVTFLGELPLEKCDVNIGAFNFRWGCKEIKHSRPLFGYHCVNNCGFK